MLQVTYLVPQQAVIIQWSYDLSNRNSFKFMTIPYDPRFRSRWDIADCYISSCVPLDIVSLLGKRLADISRDILKYKSELETECSDDSFDYRSIAEISSLSLLTPKVMHSPLLSPSIRTSVLMLSFTVQRGRDQCVVFMRVSAPTPSNGIYPESCWNPVVSGSSFLDIDTWLSCMPIFSASTSVSPGLDSMAVCMDCLRSKDLHSIVKETCVN